MYIMIEVYPALRTFSSVFLSSGLESVLDCEVFDCCISGPIGYNGTTFGVFRQQKSAKMWGEGCIIFLLENNLF